jgi:hypothetical protein
LPRSTGLPGALPAAGRLGDAPVDTHVGQVQPDHPLVGIQNGQPQPIEQTQPDPLVPAAAQRGGRAGPVAQALVAAAEHQRLDELVEDDAVLDARPMAAQGMVIDALGQQREELLAQRVKDARWDGGHEVSTDHGASAPS